MSNNQAEINSWKEVIKSVEQGIISSFSATKAGMNGKEIYLVVRDCLNNIGMHPLYTLEVKYGKMISPDLELQKKIQEGDFISINLAGRVNDFTFDLKRASVVGQPTPQQTDYLEHLVEATDWMIQTIKPGRSMTFYSAESRGRLITPIAYEIDTDLREIQRITAREQFFLPVGTILCIAPSIKSPEFGTMTHSEMIILREQGVDILR